MERNRKRYKAPELVVHDSLKKIPRQDGGRQTRSVADDRYCAEGDLSNVKS